MKFGLKTFLLLLIFSQVPGNSSAQDEACPKFLIPLTVRDTRGEVIHSYSAADLEVKLNGDAQLAENIHRETRLRRIVILLDASGSMKGIGKEVPWRQAVASAQILTTLSRGRAHLALIIFGERINEQLGFAQDNLSVEKRLGELEKDQSYLDRQIHGMTHLNDALESALQMLKQPTSADELYVASDGGENGSSTSLGKVTKHVVDSGVRVFFAQLKLPADLGQRRREPIVGLDFSELPPQTGGARMLLSPSGMELGFDTRTKFSLTDGIRMFFEGMFENDVLELTGREQDKKNLKIGPSAQGRSLLKGAQLFYPRELYHCVSSQPQGIAH
jgi:VWA domain-containing protein